MLFKLLWQVLLLPLSIWHYCFIKISSFKKISFIEIELKGKINDLPPTSGWMSFVRPPVNRFYLKMLDLIQLNHLLSLKRSKLKKQLKEILVVIKDAKFGWSKAWEIKDILESLKQKVKVRVYLESGDALSYFAALGASEIYIPPALDLYLIGAEINSLFYSRFLTKYGVKPNFLKIGRYKGSFEKYTRNTFSPLNKRQFKELLEDFQGEFENSLYKNRSKKISPNAGNLKTKGQRNKQSKRTPLATLQKKAPYNSKEAFRLGFVDGVLYLDELKEILRKKHENAYTYFTLSKAISKAIYKQRKPIHFSQRKKIAFVTGDGVILNSKEPNPRAISYEDYAKAIKKIRKSNYDAVIFRWNSPGGSALVSDMLWAQIFQLKNQYEEKSKMQEDPWKMIPKSFEKLRDLKSKGNKKKQKTLFYVSQSDVAASGGYFLSAISKNVFSSPVSITGSVGVVSGKFNIQSTLKKFGIDSQSIETGSQSNILSPYSDFSLEQIKKLGNNMESIYELFINRIHKGRGMPASKIKKLAEGRIYSGKKAHQAGLVDHLGGLKALLESLRKELKMKPHDVMDIEFFPKIKDSFSQSFSQISPLGQSWLDHWRIFNDLGRETVFFLDDNFL